MCYNVSMKTKNIIKTGLVVAGLGALAFGAKKVADDHKLMKTQEELTAIVRDYFSEWVRLGLFYVQVYESSLERSCWLVSFLKMVVTIPLSIKMKISSTRRKSYDFS